MPLEKQKLCFVLMPFKEDMREVYDDAIRPAIEQAGFASLRVDELTGQFNINRKIIEYIFSSDAIVADLTNWNPNVFYEMGVAHAIDNKTIMIIQKKKKLPFDVSNYKCIHYEQTSAGLEKLKSQVSDHLGCFNEWRREPTNPVQDFKPHDAFIPRSDFLAVQKLLDEAKELLNHAIDPQKYQAKIEEIKSLKKELDSLHQFQKVAGRKEQDLLKQIQFLSDEKNLAQNEITKLVTKTKTLKAELRQAKKTLQERSETSSALPKVPLRFRNRPVRLSKAAVKAMLKKRGFFDSYWNKDERGFKHQFEVKIRNGDDIVIEQASDLMWQQSGSISYIDYDAANKYVDDLNKKGFAGYKDWRLPTLEEAMSLMEPKKKKKNNLYIDPIFDATQSWIWTSDPYHGAEGAHWIVGFGSGHCFYVLDLDKYVRAVRSGESVKSD